jgi:hypothetical protein
MSASIRGHSGRIKLFKAGELQNIVDITKADVNQDSSFMRSFYVGRTQGEGDQSIEGWSGTMDLEVKDASVDDFIDAIVNNNLAGVGVEEITVIMEELYDDGTVSAYVYYDCQFKMSKSQGGLTEKMTKRLEWQASARIPLN